MIRKIVFATDLGPFSAHAMEHALDLAARLEAKVIVVHAVEPLNSYAQAVVASYIGAVDRGAPASDLTAFSAGQAHYPFPAECRLLQSIKTRILASLKFERSQSAPNYDCFEDVSVVQGKPAEVVLSEAKRLDADLIVMGSHGPESMGNNVLGSVTSRVLQLSKVPVYMVPMISPRSWYKVASRAR
ncbi:universal stress protein [Aestuariicella sp. G3-2]|uniref:universal stress protein n=1 Tax=Pseudomaricurvus albidus TaxID=2842452 RepID=UPI001C0AD72C|nr:universal stress protein [Aestuariicella albida]MBU3070469.1 universal stress protein [Aestuariicella albida]